MSVTSESRHLGVVACHRNLPQISFLTAGKSPVHGGWANYAHLHSDPFVQLELPMLFQ